MLYFFVYSSSLLDIIMQKFIWSRVC